MLCMYLLIPEADKLNTELEYIYNECIDNN